jgi:YVTN family beta-propeller protein
MTLSKSGKFLIVTNTGYRENLSVLDASTGRIVSQKHFFARSDAGASSLYFGIACKDNGDGTETVAVSHGNDDEVTLERLSASGELSPIRSINLPAANNPLDVPWFVAGLAWTAAGDTLEIVANQSHAFNGFHGSVFFYSLNSNRFQDPVAVGSFPLSILALKDGSSVVANEGGRQVTWLNGSGEKVSDLDTGEQPTYMAVNHAGTKVYVSNSNSDTVSEVDLATHAVTKTIMVRPGGLRGYPGVTPLGLALSPDDHRLYVAVADLNAVAVIDPSSGKLLGYVPVGWYPTSVAVSPDGQRLFVANAKGTKSVNPNSKPVQSWGQYDENIIEGGVSMIRTEEISQNLTQMTQAVQRFNRGFAPNKDWINNPGIKHVVYIVKENRTYDQVLGDLPKANGDPSLTLFGAEVTPNQHALATRFGIFDNFYVCAEVSADGWNWSTSGQGNEYTERNVPYNYSGRGRDYDFEGTNNNSPVDLEGRRDVAASSGGYLWDSVLQKGLSVRNYGMFLQFGSKLKGPDGQPISVENAVDKKALVPVTCLDFPKFELRYPDSDAWTKLGLTPTKTQMLHFGSHKDSSRVGTWLREFQGYLTKGDFPNLNLIRLPRDHTSGTAPGQSSPRAMVADNDYAVGEIVDAISHSPFWKSTAIFVVEDDAQAGFDHVDCHRSGVLVVSPYLQRDQVDSGFYNTDSVLATIENLLRCKPGNQYLATAHLFDKFRSDARNVEPYNAIAPSEKILSEVNTRRSYRSGDSEKLVSTTHEESGADMVLNEILWRSIKGERAALPLTPGAMAPDHLATGLVTTGRVHSGNSGSGHGVRVASKLISTEGHSLPQNKNRLLEGLCVSLGMLLRMLVQLSS